MLILIPSSKLWKWLFLHILKKTNALSKSLSFVNLIYSFHLYFCYYDEVQHLFICLRALHFPRSLNCLSVSFAHFYSRRFFLQYWRCTLCIKDFRPLVAICKARIFSEFVCFLILLMVIFFDKKNLSFYKFKCIKVFFYGFWISCHT